MTYQITNDAVIEKITFKQKMSTRSLCVSILHLTSLSVRKTPRRPECKSNKLSVEHLTSTQLEADTRLLLHTIDATERRATSLSIHSPDTDVLVLALWRFASLCDETSVVVGTGDTRRSIPLRPLYDSLGGQLGAALPGFDAFTGCDQTGTICGKSKVSCRNTLSKAEQQVLKAFASLGSSAHVQDDVAMRLELNMCHLYAPSTHITTVKEMRWFLFSKKQYAD